MAVFREPPPADTPDAAGAAATAVVPGRKDKKGRDVGEISQARLMVRRFKQSKLAVAGGIVLLLLYVLAALAPFLSPNNPELPDTARNKEAPTQIVWSGGPAMCPTKQVKDKKNFRNIYVKDCKHAVPLQFFAKGWEYKLFGVIETDIHLFGVEKPNKVLFWGADEEGRDVFSRTLHGGQVSLTVGLLGVGIATILATIIGNLSGYFGGKIDTFIQRGIEIFLSIPTIPLWATLAAAMPMDVPIAQRYFFITLVLSLVAWAGLARQVRGKVMGFSNADYVHAARAAGAGHWRIIMTHMVPNSFSHVIVVAMLAIPATILAETSLSFIGVGMVEPAISWGVMLQDATDPSVIEAYPWRMIPVAAVIITVTAYQLLSDGIRDAVDPYG